MAREKDSPEEIAREVAGGGQLGNLVSGTLSSPRGKEAVSPKIRVRRVASGNRVSYQLERFEGQKSFHHNLNADEVVGELSSLLGAVYSRAEFAMEGGTLQVLANRKGELAARRVVAHRDDPDRDDPDRDDAEPTHDRQKTRLLPEGTPIPFLVDLGVMTAEGRVVKSMYAKFRQINRFVEFVDDVLPDIERASVGRPIEIVDFGCGKSYLTFALHHYLAETRGLAVRVTGLDLKDDVIARCSNLARKLECEGLRFLRDDIASYAPDARPDLVVSLHACDTATDAALAQAVRWETPVILSVPCCQHELSAALSARGPAGSAAESATESDGARDLRAAFRHGILRERISALFTDAIRAEALEVAGYRVQILEFIDMEHTPKNLLIRAVRADSSAARDGQISGAGATSLERYLGAELALTRELALARNTARLDGKNA